MKTTKQKPVLVIDDCWDGNSFVLLVRARQAMRDADCSEAEIYVFESMAGMRQILTTPTSETPPVVYKLLLKEVKRHFELVSQPERRPAA